MGPGAAAEGPGARCIVGVGAGAAAVGDRSGDEFREAASPCDGLDENDNAATDIGDGLGTEASAFAASTLEHKLRLVNRRQTRLNGLDILAHDEPILRICLLGGNKRGSLLRRIWDSCDSCCRAFEGVNILNSGHVRT